MRYLYLSVLVLVCLNVGQAFLINHQQVIIGQAITSLSTCSDALHKSSERLRQSAEWIDLDAEELAMFTIQRLDTHGARDLGKEALDQNGRLKIMPTDFYREASPTERSLFAVTNGLYLLPTTELVNWLHDLIDNRPALEIGAGNGALAKALNIRATDNHQQADPVIRDYYAALRQPTVVYGDNVEKLDALCAVEKYRPSIVLGAWVTHQWNPKEPERHGNAQGVDEIELLQQVDYYIFLGNQRVHSSKPLWDDRPPAVYVEAPPFLFSRAMNGTPDFIAVWEGRIR